MYLNSKTNIIVALACKGKKLAFHKEICELREQRILKIGLFHLVKELFKSNQTRYVVSPGYLDSKTERVFDIACTRKKFAIHTEICEFRE